jgi:biotin/methionine sulfoxide reductase
MLAEFAPIREQRLATPSGRIELIRAHAGFGYDDCPPHPTRLEPSEWLGMPGPTRFTCVELPRERLHSQMDMGPVSALAKVADARRWQPPGGAGSAASRMAMVRLFNARGSRLAGAVVDAVAPGVRLLWRSEGLLSMAQGAPARMATPIR